MDHHLLDSAKLTLGVGLKLVLRWFGAIIEAGMAKIEILAISVQFNCTEHRFFSPFHSNFKANMGRITRAEQFQTKLNNFISFR
jgi:hypothetical protein